MCPNNADRMANILDPDQTAPCSSRSSLIWVYTVCPDLSVSTVRPCLLPVVDRIISEKKKGEPWQKGPKCCVVRESSKWAAARQNQQNNMRPAKTQISLGIRTIWSESSLCAHWVAKDPSFLHADSEEWADAQADLSLHWAHIRRV